MERCILASQTRSDAARHPRRGDADPRSIAQGRARKLKVSDGPPARRPRVHARTNSSFPAARSIREIAVDGGRRPARCAGLPKSCWFETSRRSPEYARALALAAIRETFEETGLALGVDGPQRAAGSPRRRLDAIRRYRRVPDAGRPRLPRPRRSLRRAGRGGSTRGSSSRTPLQESPIRAPDVIHAAGGTDGTRLGAARRGAAARNPRHHPRRARPSGDAGAAALGSLAPAAVPSDAAGQAVGRDDLISVLDAPQQAGSS